MTPDQIRLIQETFDFIRPSMSVVTEMFYTRLFHVAPEMRELFPDDMKEQRRKLRAMLAHLVDNLTGLEELVPAIQELGCRHTKYAADRSDYNTVSDALIWTLEQGLGEMFTDEVREAWAAAFDTLSEIMIEAAEAQDAA